VTKFGNLVSPVHLSYLHVGWGMQSDMPLTGLGWA
jgi:hypothetical protein